jgi:hypothetical protein
VTERLVRVVPAGIGVVTSSTTSWPATAASAATATGPTAPGSARDVDGENAVTT